MSNLKQKDYFDCITGETVDDYNYGKDAKIFKKTDNIDLIYDSHGNYLGLRCSMGKFENENGKDHKGKYIWSKGPYYYKSTEDLKVWGGIKCSPHIGIKLDKEAFVEISKKKLTDESINTNKNNIRKL